MTARTYRIDIVYGLPATPKDEMHIGLLVLKAWVEEGKAPDPGLDIGKCRTAPLCGDADKRTGELLRPELQLLCCNPGHFCCPFNVKNMVFAVKYH